MNARLAATRAFRYAARRPVVQSRYSSTLAAASRATGSQSANNETTETTSWRLAAAAALAVGALGVQHKTDCCGIAGVVGIEHHDAR